MYFTYDVRQTSTDQATNNVFLRGGKEFTVPGRIVGWEVGEFPDPHTGIHRFGVRVNYQHPQKGPAHEFVEIPATAENVQLREDLPPEFHVSTRHAA